MNDVRRKVEETETAMLERLGSDLDRLEEVVHVIEMRDAFESSLKIVKPRDAAPGPLVVLIFGGGFMAGSKNQLTEEARTIAHLFGATVANISYRLSPEHKFPVGQLDAWDSLKWIADNVTGPLLNADPSKGFLIGGVSSGASISAALTRKFQEENIAHSITGQWLSVPAIYHEDNVPEKYKKLYISVDQNAVGSFTREERRKRREACGWDMSSDLAFAGNSKSPLSGQPRTYFQVDGMDALRDDGLIYDELLKEAGVATKIDFYPGCPHAHWMELLGTEVADRARIDTIVGFGWLLEKEVSREEIAKLLGIAPRNNLAYLRLESKVSSR